MEGKSVAEVVVEATAAGTLRWMRRVGRTMMMRVWMPVAGETIRTDTPVSRLSSGITLTTQRCKERIEKEFRHENEVEFLKPLLPLEWKIGMRTTKSGNRHGDAMPVIRLCSEWLAR